MIDAPWPMYLRVARLVRRGIRKGVHPVRRALPSVAQPAETCEVSATVIGAALRELGPEGPVTGGPDKIISVVDEPGRAPAGCLDS